MPARASRCIHNDLTLSSAPSALALNPKCKLSKTARRRTSSTWASEFTKSDNTPPELSTPLHQPCSQWVWIGWRSQNSAANPPRLTSAAGGRTTRKRGGDLTEAKRLCFLTFLSGCIRLSHSGYNLRTTESLHQHCGAIVAIESDEVLCRVQ